MSVIINYEVFDLENRKAVKIYSIAEKDKAIKKRNLLIRRHGTGRYVLRPVFRK